MAVAGRKEKLHMQEAWNNSHAGMKLHTSGKLSAVCHLLSEATKRHFPTRAAPVVDSCAAAATAAAPHSPSTPLHHIALAEKTYYSSFAKIKSAFNPVRITRTVECYQY